MAISNQLESAFNRIPSFLKTEAVYSIQVSETVDIVADTTTPVLSQQNVTLINGLDKDISPLSKSQLSAGLSDRLSQGDNYTALASSFTAAPLSTNGFMTIDGVRMKVASVVTDPTRLTHQIILEKT